MNTDGGRDGHNEQRLAEAVEKLRRVVDQAIRKGEQGVFGVRLNVSRRKIGTVRTVEERE